MLTQIKEKTAISAAIVLSLITLSSPVSWAGPINEDPGCQEVLSKLEIGTTCQMNLGMGDFWKLSELVAADSYDFSRLLVNKFSLTSVNVSVLPPSQPEFGPTIRYLIKLATNLKRPNTSTEAFLRIDSYTKASSPGSYKSSGMLMEDLESELKYDCPDSGWKVSAFGPFQESYPPIADCFNSDGDVKHVLLILKATKAN